MLCFDCPPYQKIRTVSEIKKADTIEEAISPLPKREGKQVMGERNLWGTYRGRKRVPVIA